MSFRRDLPALTLACFVQSCGALPTTAPARLDDTTLPDSPVSRLLPLADGTIWSYDAEDDAGNKGIFVTRARRLTGPRFSLLSGQRSHTLEVRSDGIARLESNAYLLRAPLSEQATWPGEGGAVVRVKALDRSVDVPAGKFVGCVETVEELRNTAVGDPVRRITTTYCPDVGIVTLYAEAWDGGRRLGERAILRSFGKPVSLQ